LIITPYAKVNHFNCTPFLSLYKIFHTFIQEITLTMKKWIHAFRLKTLPLSVAGIIMGAAIAAIDGFVNGLLFAYCIIATILFQILSNLANDLGDASKGVDNDNRLGPKRSVQSGAISAKGMKNGIIITSILAFIFTALTAYEGTKGLNKNFLILFIILGIASIGAAIKYTMGKKPYGYSGLGDVFVFLFFGWLSVLGSNFLLSHTFNFLIMLPASSIGLLAAGVLNMNNMRDHENDALNNKNTLIVRMGFNLGKHYHALLLICAMVMLIQFNLQYQLKFALWACFVPFFVLVLNIIKVYRTSNPQHLEPELKKIALTTFAISIIYFIDFLIYTN
jgi:1,4-dihydroxy-2-naphthoate polyprenyltransferase